MRLPHWMRRATISLIGFMLIGSLCWLIGLDAVDAAGSTISGVVTDEAGHPLANIAVQLYEDPWELGIWTPALFAGTTDTMIAMPHMAP